MTLDYDRDRERWYESVTISLRLPIAHVGTWITKLWRLLCGTR